MRHAVTICTLLLMVCLVEAVVLCGLVSPLVVARPSEVLATLPGLFIEEGLGERFLITFSETFAATALAVAVGVPIGWLFYSTPMLDLAFRRWLAVLAAAPMILLYPLFLLAFGRNFGTVVAIGFVAALAPIALKTRDGLIGIRRVLVEVGESFRLNHTNLFFRIMLPAAMPTIVTGIRIGLIFALINVVAIEFLINFGGLGQLVVEMADRYETAGMYGAILLISVSSAVFYAATERLERWFRPI